ncbi:MULTISPECIES: Rpp14/Pop5 family protein [Halostella]|uniref:Rpp14/Pop5 family protein n=1 Tax=Halostella TaxID=1843185 RepID=UPI001081696F|nr:MULTISPECIES: Rpp14/Pop5 family protein [Halostella]
MKHLPKHLRPKWRYLAVGIETWPDGEVERGPFQRELWYAAQNLVGDAGSADADLTLLDFEFEDGYGETIVRVRHGHTDEARAAIACIDEVDGHPVGVVVRGMSGTIRACEEKYLGRRGEFSAQRTVAFENQERTAVVRNGTYDVRTDGSFSGATELDFE